MSHRTEAYLSRHLDRLERWFVIVGALTLCLAEGSVVPLVTFAVVEVLRLATVGRVRVIDNVTTLAAAFSFASVHVQNVLGVPILFAFAHFLIAAQVLLMFSNVRQRAHLWLLSVGIAVVGVSAMTTVYGLFVVFLLIWLWLLVRVFVFARILSDMPMKEGATLSEPNGIAALAPLTRWTRPGGSLVVLSFVLAIPLFFLVPRMRPRIARTVRVQGQSVTGFSEEVALGRMTTQELDYREVMRVQLTDERTGQVITPATAPPLLWRGMTYDHYENGRWRITTSNWQLRAGSRLPARKVLETIKGPRLIRQRIVLEPIGTKVIFALYPVLTFYPPPGERRVWCNRECLDMLFVRRHFVRTTYEVVSLDVPFVPSLNDYQADIGFYSAGIYRYLQVPSNIADSFRHLAMSIAPLDKYRDPMGRAQRIQKYLSDSGRFEYAFSCDMRDKGDPVYLFLTKYRMGNCQYFASSMALLLRSINIPSRLVCGFRGGEWNKIGKFFTVRQLHAHSWVEAYFDKIGWVPFDPTPPLPLPRRSRWRAIAAAFDYLSMKWMQYFVGYSRKDQAALAARVVSVVKQVQNTSSPLWAVLREWWDDTRFKVFAASLLLLVALVARSVKRSGRRSNASPTERDGRRGRKRLLAWMWKDPPARKAFLKLLAMVEKVGVRRPPSMTAFEFCDQLGIKCPACAEDARWIAVHFCEERYGRRTLGSNECKDLKTRLRRIQRLLRNERRSST